MVQKQTLVKPFPKKTHLSKSELRKLEKKKIKIYVSKSTQETRKDLENNLLKWRDLDNLLKWHTSYSLYISLIHDNFSLKESTILLSLLKKSYDFRYSSIFYFYKFLESEIPEYSKDARVSTNFFYLPIKDDIENIMQQNPVRIMDEFSKVISAIEQHKDPSIIITQIENLRLVIAIIKGSYEYGTLNFELYFGIEKELLSLVERLEENDFSKALSHSLELKSVFAKMVENMEFLQKLGVPLLTFKYTGKEKDGMKIYQVKIN